MKFSICILCYNQEDSIRAAVDSALNQTYRDVEVICVDDCSTDGSVAILKEYESRRNFKLVQLAENSGAFAARLAGMAAATGDYLIFLDGDDRYAPNACRSLLRPIRRTGADIISFGIEKFFRTPPAKGQKEYLDRALKPLLENLEGDEICKAAYVKETLSYSLVCKAFSARVVKEAVDYFGPKPPYICMYDDYCMFFFLANFARSHTGIADNIYLYNVGHGMSTSKYVSESRILNDKVSILNGHRICYEFAREQGIYEEYGPIFYKHEMLAMASCITKTLPMPRYRRNRLLPKLYDVISADMMSYLAEIAWFDSPKYAQNLNLSHIFPITRTEIKTIAMYYHRLYSGGVERVITLLTGVFMNLGYKVVIITDEAENEKDYELPAGVDRVVLSGEIEHGGKDYPTRARRLLDAIEKYHIDAVVYHAWLNENLFWDMSIIKSTGAAFIVHCHGAFISLLDEGWLGVQNVAPAYTHADAVCTLSSTDQLYWQQRNMNTYCVQNPFTLTERVTEPGEVLDTVVWFGRFEPGKNPEDALLIMREVMHNRPDAKLYMVGDISDKQRQEYNELLRELNLESNVVITGFQENVQPYYSMADVVLSTSNYEGFPMVFGESFANHVPIVTYSLPHLTILERTEAAISVPWKDIPGAANAILDILNDREEHQMRSDAAGAKFRQMSEYDYAGHWQQILNSTIDGSRPPHMAANPEAFDTFAQVVNLANRQMATKISVQRVEAAAAARREVYGSVRYQVGNAIAFVPVKLRSLARAIRAYGVVGTLKKILGMQ